MSLFDPRRSSWTGSGDGHVRNRVVHEEERRAVRSDLGVATLACEACDAPVPPGPVPLRPDDDLRCPFCARVAPVRDFLSLGEPSRPARVVVRVHLSR